MRNNRLEIALGDVIDLGFSRVGNKTKHTHGPCEVPALITCRSESDRANPWHIGRKIELDHYMN